MSRIIDLKLINPYIDKPIPTYNKSKSKPKTCKDCIHLNVCKYISGFDLDSAKTLKLQAIFFEECKDYEDAGLSKKILALQKELDTTDELLQARDEVIALIPECEAHGNNCLPNARRWIQEKIDGFSL